MTRCHPPVIAFDPSNGRQDFSYALTSATEFLIALDNSYLLAVANNGDLRVHRLNGRHPAAGSS